MSDGHWGNCKGCRFFDSHNPQPGNGDTHQCMQPELQEFELEVTGESGCNHYEARLGLDSTTYYEEPAPSIH
ncbi:MAG TPA: hypothetical protein VE153_10590 [Myxococcus sp.]|nr:hypothetical protein [Myxococcus sp.]